MVNNVLNHAAATVDTTHTYDNFARPLQSVKTLDTNTGNVFTTQLGYDGWGRLITTSYQHGNDTPKQFGQRYNNYGYLNLVEREFVASQLAQIIWQPTNQDASNRVLQAQLGNGLIDNRCYDAGSGYLADGVIANSAVNCGNMPATMAMEESYTYDTLGNVTSRTQAWNSGITGSAVAPISYNETFGYDGLNRLTSSTVLGAAPQGFTYDLSGNITSKTGNGNYHYLTNNVKQPHAVATIDGMSGSFS